MYGAFVWARGALNRPKRRFSARAVSGEDPFLGAALAGPVVRGIQGQGVMACAKHYVDNSQVR